MSKTEATADIPAPAHKPTTLTLSAPKAGIDTLTMRVPSRLDMKKAHRAAPDDAEERQDILIASLCGVEIHDIEALELSDYLDLVEALEAYSKKPSPPATGTGST